MKNLLLRLASLCFALALAPAWAQQQQPATLSITPTTLPEVLQVLDNRGNWAAMGSLTPGGPFGANIVAGQSQIAGPCTSLDAVINIGGTIFCAPQGSGGGGGVPPVNVLAVGMQPANAQNCTSLATCFDNSALQSAIILANGAIGCPGFPWGFHQPSSDCNTYNTISGSGAYFPPIPTQAVTPYFFSRALDWYRGGTVMCGGNGSKQNTWLVFAPGVDGVIQDFYTTSPDGGEAYEGNTQGCGVYSLGYGLGANVAGTATIDSISMPGWGVIPGTQWEVGDGVIATPGLYTQARPQPIGSVPILSTPSGDYVTGVTGSPPTALTLAQPTLNFQVGNTSGQDWKTAVIRLPQELTYNVNTLAPVTISATAAWALNDQTLPVTTCAGIVSGETILDSTWPTTSTTPTTRIGTVAACAGNVVTILEGARQCASTQGGVACSGTADQLQFVSYNATMTGSTGNNPAPPQILLTTGEMVWSDAFKFGSTIWSAWNGVPNVTPTTWNASAAPFTASIAAQTMNVTALTAGASICVGGTVTQVFGQPAAVAAGTAVTAVPGGGPCSTATGNYTVSVSQTVASESMRAAGVTIGLNSPCPTGIFNSLTTPILDVTSGVSLGNGACSGSNLTLAQWNTSGTAGDQLALPVYSTSLPLATAAGNQSFQFGGVADAGPTTPTGLLMYAQAGHGGGTGRLWKVPYGINRRTGADSRQNALLGWTVGLRLGGSSGSLPNTGGTSDYDEKNYFQSDFIGRLAIGNNSGASTSHANVYGDNFFADIVETGTVGSVYLGDNPNSGESSTSPESVMGYCAGTNDSVFIGMYVGQNKYNSYCMDPFGTLNAPVYPAQPGVVGNAFIVPSNGAPSGAAIINKTGYTVPFGGAYQYTGPHSMTVTATGMNGSSTTDVLAPTSPSSFFADTSLTITDLTNPTFIPAGTHPSSIIAGHIILSLPVTSPVLNGDTLQISNVTGYPCINLRAGLGGTTGFDFDKNCTGTDAVNWALNGYRNLWAYSQNPSGDAPAFAPMTGFDYLGYGTYSWLSPPQVPVAPAGMLLGPGTTLGSERLANYSATSPTGSFHLRGDVSLNQAPSPGGAMAWADTAVFSTTLTAAFTTTTGSNTISVAACPANAPTGTVYLTDTAFSPPMPFGTFVSCSAPTLTFTAMAANIASLAANDGINFLQWRPGGLLSEDAAGNTYMLGQPVAQASLPGCTTVVPAGVHGTVTNGIAAPTYLEPVSGAGVGTSHRGVLCDDSGSWLYH